MCLSCWFRQLKNISKLIRVCKTSKVISCLCLSIFLLFVLIPLAPFKTSLRIGFRFVGVLKPFWLCQALTADMYTLIVVDVTDQLKCSAKYTTTSLSAGKAQTLCRQQKQKCLNHRIPALYVALVEGTNACLITSFRLIVKAFLKLQVWVLG